MRTVIFVASLLGLALVSGASFVVKAQDADPSATLEYDCSPTPIPSGIDTLVSCTFTAHNTGSAALRDVRLTFQPGAGSLPDAYYFVSAGAKGVPDAPVAENQLDYRIGDLAPGTSTTLSVEVIIRSSAAYAADAALLDGQAHEYARVALNGAVGGDAQDRPAVVTIIERRDAAGHPTATFDITVSNRLKQQLDGKLRLYFGQNAVLAAPDGWQLQPEMATRVIAGVAPGEGYSLTVTFGPGPRPCPFVHPAAVLVTRDAEAAAIGDGSVSLGACGGQGGGEPANVGASLVAGAAASSLPATGDGTPATAAERARTALLVLAFGGLLVAAGLSVRRARRR